MLRLLTAFLFIALMSYSGPAFALARIPFPANKLQPQPPAVAPDISGNVHSTLQAAPQSSDNQSSYGTNADTVDQGASVSDDTQSNDVQANSQGGFPWLPVIGGIAGTVLVILLVFRLIA
ncbi:MAG TPA: hypothetical protein VMU27_00080 [Candidatus Paceibacterota bacterium]|nr:hypothetical protein [Candidatus Paceibacterota bacterium]